LGNGDCCASLLVQGGTFDRSYDDLDFTDPSYPATVNDFYLDKYEITVSRFRAFVNAGMGTQASPPASGMGAHPLIAGSGWDSTWNTNLPKDTASLRQAMDDCGGNWTDRALSNESQPQNCLDWYTAFAFCAWDGGRLATEAEWNYAASGGNEQRYYPWSSPPTSTTIDDTYAVYCGGSCGGTQNVGSKSPKGDGKWGQSDLGGNVGEWTLDWYAEPYSMPCDNCAYLTEASGSCPVVRGGVFDEGAAHLRSAGRGVSSLCAKGRYFTLGARCARTSYGTGTGTGDAGVPDAPSAQPDVPMGGSGGGTGGAGGIGGGGGASGGTTSSTGGTSIVTTTGALQGPSCTGLPATCGPSGNESCCMNLLVPGGTFNRSNDTNYPATVSDFYLDKYETTVGRFRQFVGAGMGTQTNPPAAGAGAHPLIAGSGWDATWNTHLPADTASLEAVIKCDSTFQTWTDIPGGGENRPMNCIDWYEAFAFCAWDGGRLATEAEWNYAAAGGNEQRVFPWSVPPTSTTSDYTMASYECMGDGVPGCSLTDFILVGTKPAGNGRWGHSDLAGNVAEWTFDWYSDSYPLPCDDCAELTLGPGRGVRGGHYNNQPYAFESSFRGYVAPQDGSEAKGVRCAKQ